MSVDDKQGRHGGISYLHVPALDVRRSARFYAEALGWEISNPDSDRPSFADGGGYVVGAFVTNQQPSREPGLLPYVFVDDLDATIDRVVAAGGEIVEPAYPEGNLRVATFRDPAGNVLGLWAAAKP